MFLCMIRDKGEGEIIGRLLQAAECVLTPKQSFPPDPVMSSQRVSVLICR